MTTDARFADGADQPLRLIAREAADVPVMAALIQDAVLTVADLRLDRRRRRLAALIGRFRWEDRSGTGHARHAPERVRSLLVIEDVTALRSQGIDRSDPGGVLSLLSLSWAPGEDGAGRLTVTLAGGGALEIGVEALEIRLEDVSRPYAAPSGRTPQHPDG